MATVDFPKEEQEEQLATCNLVACSDSANTNTNISIWSGDFLVIAGEFLVRETTSRLYSYENR